MLMKWSNHIIQVEHFLFRFKSSKLDVPLSPNKNINHISMPLHTNDMIDHFKITCSKDRAQIEHS